MTLRDCLERLRARDGVFDGWTDPMLRTVLRNESRLQTAVNGAVGLAEWDSVRLPTRREITRQCIAEGAGRARIDVIQARIQACYGAWLPRSAIAWGAWGLGARLQGEEVVLRTQGESLPPAPSIPGIPQASASIFEALRTQPPSPPEELSAAIGVHVRRFFDESVTNEGIDLTVVAEVQRKAQELLALYPSSDDEDRKVISAAVHYFLRADDGAWDFSPGGLDDDLAVLDAILDLLRDGAPTS